MSIKDRVAIIGVGATKFGENFEMTYQDMAWKRSTGLPGRRPDTKDMEAPGSGLFLPV